MPAERETAERTRARSRLSLGAPSQQCQQRDARHQNICNYVHPTLDVTTGSHYVHRQGDDQQAGRTNVRGLKVPVAWPQPPADCGARGQGEKEQSEQRQNPGVFVTRGGQLDMLNNAVIGAEQ